MESPEPSLSEREPFKVSPVQPGGRAEAGKHMQGNPDSRMQRFQARVELRAIVARHARNHPEALRAALKNAPPSVQQALRRAIAVSEAGYKNAQQALD